VRADAHNLLFQLTLDKLLPQTMNFFERHEHRLLSSPPPLRSVIPLLLQLKGDSERLSSFTTNFD
jgi:hypothetical protein